MNNWCTLKNSCSFNAVFTQQIKNASKCIETNQKKYYWLIEFWVKRIFCNFFYSLNQVDFVNEKKNTSQLGAKKYIHIFFFLLPSYPDFVLSDLEISKKCQIVFFSSSGWGDNLGSFRGQNWLDICLPLWG